jgi:hypothetical protein
MNRISSGKRSETDRGTRQYGTIAIASVYIPDAVNAAGRDVGLGLRRMPMHEKAGD